MPIVLSQDRTGLDRFPVDGKYIVRTKADRLLFSHSQGVEVIELVNAPVGSERSFYLDARGNLWWASTDDIKFVRIGPHDRFEFRELEVGTKPAPYYPWFCQRDLTGAFTGGVGTRAAMLGVVCRTGRIAVRSCYPDVDISSQPFIRIGRGIASNALPGGATGGAVAIGAVPFDVTLQGVRTAPLQFFYTDSTSMLAAGATSEANWNPISLYLWDNAGWRNWAGRGIPAGPVILGPGDWFAMDMGSTGGIHVWMLVEEVTDAWRP